MSMPRHSPAVILVVEDDEVTLEALCDVLHMLHYQVLTADSSMKAVEIFKQERVDLVLSDLVMPEMNGKMLFEALRGIDPEVKLILLTGFPLDEMGEELLQSGIFALVQKPPDIDVIAGKVQEALNSAR